MEDACPASDIGLCKCKLNLKMLHHDAFSFYPKAMCFRVGRQLYSVRRLAVGKHFWEVFLSNQTNLTRTSVQRIGEDSLRTLYSTIKQDEYVRTVVMTVKLSMYGLPPVMHIWSIQRQMRRFLQHRKVAVMMALHARLGVHSLLACLPEDVIMEIIITHKKN